MALNPNQTRINRYPRYAPRLWHAMSFRVFWKLLQTNNFNFTWDRFGIVAGAFCVSFVNSILNRITQAIFGHMISNTELNSAPIFIVGHWRTGTTYLHELLACDQRYVAPNNYQCMAPGHFLLTEKLLAPLLQRLVPKQRPQDNVAIKMDGPQEDEFALLALGIPSIYRTLAFPVNGFVDSAYLSLRDISDDERHRWMTAWTRFLRSVTYRGKGRPLLLKSPAHTARVKTLLKVFPDARFVHVTRNPYRLFESTTHMINALAKTQTLQIYDTAILRNSFEDDILNNLKEIYECFEEDRRLIPDDRIVDVSYENLISNPKTVVQDIYKRLKMDFSEVDNKIDNIIQQKNKYISNAYVSDDKEPGRVTECWHAYIERYRN